MKAALVVCLVAVACVVAGVGGTSSPTVSPTKAPTVSPTTSPTVSPTTSPTVSPTKNPTKSPTKDPTVSPTTSPTVSPTKDPTVSPTTSPTGSPTTSPTNGPTTSPTGSPTKDPTVSPTTSPTGSPTTSPTNGPTTSPTVSPTKDPTVSPTTSPTGSPTTSPTNGPTTSPTGSPTISPNVSPTQNPTVSPTQSPTTTPTTSPTKNPTVSPTKNPTSTPSTSPTSNPTISPTTSPTNRHLAGGDGEWSLSAIYLHKVMYEDDVIYFKWIDAEHNVMKVEDYDGTDQCNDGDTVMDWTASDGYHHVNYTFTTNKTYYFYCNKLNHCDEGMQKTVTVLQKGATYTNATRGHKNDPYDQMKVKGCALGYYQDEQGATSCKTSTSCEAGKYVFNHFYSNKSEATENRYCKTCPVDRYSTSDNSQSCTSCETGKRANMQRTGCEDSDGGGMPTWVWGAIGGGAGVAALLIGAVIFSRNKAMKRKGYKEIKDNKEGEDGGEKTKSNIRALIF